MTDGALWRVKLAAWTHDPAEKALVLLRDPAGHEWGTSAELRERIFGQRHIPAELAEVVRRADRWASAADRPQWPRAESDPRFAAWQQVRFVDDPVLIHPLSGEQLSLERLPDVGVETIKALSRDHFMSLIDEDGDPEKTALAFWRFGPTIDAKELKNFWGLLPADTRVPDHTIWQHLDLTAAFATAMWGGKSDPALLTMSFGPVQDFIAQARTTSDLWAGSHLLARIAWEALRVLCDAVGPDTVLFPQLRGVPLVDAWLRDDKGLPPALFSNEEWTESATDANPLFTATLPNRFVALVPSHRIADLVRDMEAAVREWVGNTAHRALEKLAPDPPQAALRQIEEQLHGFPEIHWAAVEWGEFVAEPRGILDDSNLQRLREEIEKFAPGDGSFLGSNAWRLLSREISIDGQQFYRPNAGTLYPAMYQLLDRAQAAAKSVRPFRQLPQEGYRCSLCGEREWLTDDRTLLGRAPGKREQSLWSKHPQGAFSRKGEHLCALCTVKRVWPILYCEDAARSLGDKPDRFVVSTHTMALATDLGRWLRSRGKPPGAWVRRLAELAEKGRVALPRRLARELRGAVEKAMLRGVPLWLEDNDEKRRDPATSQAAERNRKELVLDVLGKKEPEAYYALILMDGDHMGAWLSGLGRQGEEYLQSFRDTWHPQLRTKLDQRNDQGRLAEYLNERRPVSPARHMAISSALNAFSSRVVPHVVEEVCKGRVIYAGGDDVLAMVSVDDLLPALLLLRLAYGGVLGGDWQGFRQLLRDVDCEGLQRLRFRRGHVQLNGRLYRMMGHRATASTGAVVAHHQAPLGAVLRRLRAAETEAKNSGRDAFSVRLLKRSGGDVSLTSRWFAEEPEGDVPTLDQAPIAQLIALRDRFAGKEFSRRAAYLTSGWLGETPRDALPAMLAHQFRQQTSRGPKDQAACAGAQLAQTAMGMCSDDAQVREYIENFLAVAEFLAREGRGPETKDDAEDRADESDPAEQSA